jgi:hypothetical protein
MMTTLADMQFEELKSGMKFRHPEHGEQVILDLGRGQLGPTIRFHDCSMYGGQMPQLGEEEREISVFQLLAENTYPRGAEQWEYEGEVGPEEIAACGWRWFEVGCPHCGFGHRFLAPGPETGSRQCTECGMVFSSPAKEVKS